MMPPKTRRNITSQQTSKQQNSKQKKNKYPIYYLNILQVIIINYNHFQTVFTQIGDNMDMLSPKSRHQKSAIIANYIYII